MAQVFLGLGSNINANAHIAKGLTALHTQFGELQLSPIYESESLGFVGDNFLNLVVEIATDLTAGQLLESLRAIENASGRDRSTARFSGRTLDIDILTYDQLHGIIDGVHLPRDEIFTNAFVLKPFSELAPNLTIATSNKPLKDLWQEFDKKSQRLWRAEFEWFAPEAKPAKGDL